MECRKYTGATEEPSISLANESQLCDCCIAPRGACTLHRSFLHVSLDAMRCLFYKNMVCLLMFSVISVVSSTLYDPELEDTSTTVCVHAKWRHIDIIISCAKASVSSRTPPHPPVQCAANGTSTESTSKSSFFIQILTNTRRRTIVCTLHPMCAHARVRELARPCIIVSSALLTVS